MKNIGHILTTHKMPMSRPSVIETWLD